MALLKHHAAGRCSCLISVIDVSSATIQGFQTPAPVVDSKHAAGFIPVTQNYPGYFPAIVFEGMNAGAVGVSVDQQVGVVRLHSAANRILAGIHNGFVLALF
jgi:hypothetical protein